MLIPTPDQIKSMSNSNSQAFDKEEAKSMDLKPSNGNELSFSNSISKNAFDILMNNSARRSNSLSAGDSRNSENGGNDANGSKYILPH